MEKRRIASPRLYMNALKLASRESVPTVDHRIQIATTDLTKETELPKTDTNDRERCEQTQARALLLQNELSSNK